MGTNITGIGNANAIGFKSRVTGGIYFPPELKDALVGVWSAYGKSNDSTDRNIIKNKIKDRGGDFVISNAAFKLNSGFGKYEVDFTTWSKVAGTSIITDSKYVLTDEKAITNGGYFLWNRLAKDSFKVKISNIPNGGWMSYRYRITEEDTQLSSLFIREDGIYTLPATVAGSDVDFFISTASAPAKDWVGLTITQIPSFEGAFVTDGINDLITSTKTVQEMLGGSNEITVVSMMANLDSVQMMCNSNYNNTNGYNPRNTLEPNGVISMLGYTDKNGTTNNLNLIMGDKDSIKLVDEVNFNSDYVFYPAQYYGSYYKAAWYWTVIANKVLTTDQINQVIAYFNLDRTLKPDILCNTIKQGITNENHAEFGDKLIDFSGNGRDIQLNNIAWKGDSGIGKYETDFLDSSIWKYKTNSSVTSDKIVCNKAATHIMLLYYSITDENKYDVPSFNVLKQGDASEYYYIDEQGIRRTFKLLDGINTLPASHGTLFTGTEATCGFGNPGIGNSVTITQIPSHAGGLCLDGINDFGKVTGMPIYKDYTVVTDREIFANIGAILSKNNPGAFVETAGNSVYSFGQATSGLNFISTRSISYLSKYSYCGQSITAGAAEDGTDMWLGTIRDNDSRFFNGAIYSLMSFPYSMSEFLIERQLKKHKLGTLYPDMVEFRPVIKANTNYKITYYQIDSTNTWKSIKVGDYIVIGAKLAFQITFDNDASELKEVVSPQLSGIIVEKRPSNPGYNIYSYITSKSPQKINITIDEYIRYEDIVQPYPALLRFKDENGNEVSWGGKFRVGSTITRIGSAADSNLLPNIYNIFGLLLNDNQVTSSKVIVEKTMVFKAKSAYIFDNNEPKCILSPSRLRIPNSSYKLLGYIPDISGHGNHGVIHNSAYAEGSGVNEDGSYQFDGVDDFVAIPTLSSGGKQVLMKVNSLNSDVNVIYDQRLPTNMKGTFAIMCDNNLAYSSWNTGQTYIDGILNKNIIGNQLVNITHNLTITNDGVTNNNSKSPFIGKSTDTEKHANMSLYDFMLFDKISTDDKIKELNEYVGIEAKVELPPYYWDAYGKTNLDADKATIQQRGVAIGDYDLTNYNHAYEGMSGYNGYPVVFGANKTWESLSGVYGYTSDVTNTTIHVTHAEHAGNGLLFSYVKKDGALANIKEIPAFRVTIGGLEGNSKFGYRYLATEDATEETLVYLGNGTHELAKSFAPTEALLDLTRNVWVGIFITPMVEGEVVFDCDITIEVLPEYENGLAYDGITDYSKNANIPVLTDYTYIYKRTIINIPTNAATLLKGADKTNGGAFIADYGNKWQFNFGQYNIIQGIADGINWQTVNSFNGTSINKGENTDDSGITVAKFSNGYTSMVFYKLILYPKTISLLEINFLKNLMEKDEIIDLNNPIFIKNE